MFTRGSRYRNLPESSPVDAAGERLRGKDLREIPPPLDWPFRHTVREGERLDLLAFKYYGEPTKWWQIADANPQEAFPLDLLDRSPVIKERFVLRCLDFESRFRSLVLSLPILGQVSTPVETSFDGSKPVEPSFLQTTIIVTYAPSPSTHQSIVDSIELPAIGFHFLRAFEWPAPPNTAEAFTFDDRVTRDRWRTLVATLTSRGVLELQSRIAESTLDLTYNSAITSRESILTLMNSLGFTLQPATTAFTSVGSRIVIPPHQTV